MSVNRKTCDACGCGKPRHTTPGDPVRRLCHDCHFSEKLDQLRAESRRFDASLHVGGTRVAASTEDEMKHWRAMLDVRCIGAKKRVLLVGRL